MNFGIAFPIKRSDEIIAYLSSFSSSYLIFELRYRIICVWWITVIFSLWYLIFEFDGIDYRVVPGILFMLDDFWKCSKLFTLIQYMVSCNVTMLQILSLYICVHSYIVSIYRSHIYISIRYEITTYTTKLIISVRSNHLVSHLESFIMKTILRRSNYQMLTC